MTTPSTSKRELVLLEAANILGGVCNAVVMVVIPWLILERTDSPGAAGLAAAVSAIPGILIAPVVGVLVDRIGRKAVSVVSDLFSGVSVLLFPVLDAFGVLGYGAILALTVLGAAFDPAGYTARKALIPNVSAASGVPRDQLNGLHEGLFAGGWVVGPMVGALGIATVGSVATMWFAFAAFVLASAAVLAMRVPNRAPLSDDALVEASPWHAARAGVGALLRDKPLWVLTIAVTVIWMIYAPTESVLLPVHFEGADEPEAFGIVLSAMSVGAMAGAFGYGWIARRTTRHGLVRGSILLAALAYVPVALLPAPVVMVVPALLLGLAWGPMEPLLNSLVQDRFPEHQHGRIYGVQLGLFYAAPPLGQLLAGGGVEWLGVDPVFLVIAGLLVVLALGISALPVLRGLDDPSPAAPAAPLRPT
ncbi:MFS transporter [Nocardioides caldifontis]|uniref:MFS transporter n=1 Tax=Nocardioides caldifontis TaxID=2588938 RepID=UPI0011DF96A6|nr:MFS transporter [Nocardioides caldifontis]